MAATVPSPPSTLSLDSLISMLTGGQDPWNVPDLLQGDIDADGAQAAKVVVTKVYNEDSADGIDYPADNPALLARAAFREFRHFFRVGGANATDSAGKPIYPGAPFLPALGWAADAMYDVGEIRTTVQTWCNAAATALYAALSAPPSAPAATPAKVAAT